MQQPCANLLRALDRVSNTGLIVLAAAYGRRDLDGGVSGPGVKRRPFGYNTVCVTSARTRPVLPSFGIWGAPVTTPLPQTPQSERRSDRSGLALGCNTRSLGRVIFS